jgi:hypothetical protein
MSERPVFKIGKQVAGRNIYNIARDLNVNQNSSAEDILKIIDAIQLKVEEIGIADKDKKVIGNYLDNARNKLQDKEPDKQSISESIKKTSEILQRSKAAAESLRDIGMLVGKAAIWLGTTVANLGWASS